MSHKNQMIKEWQTKVQDNLPKVYFSMLAIGYIVTTILIFTKPRNVILYYIILAGTIIIIIVYYFRTMTGIPVIGKDLIIKEYYVDYRDVIKKIIKKEFV